MQLRSLVLALALLPLLSACDKSTTADDKAKAAADAKAKEKEESDARMAKRKAEREQEAADEQAKQDAIAAKIQEITVIPEGTKLPKKMADACKQVIDAQSSFMGKFYPEVDAAALTTQLGMLAKQCNEMTDIEVAMCQKFALDQTTEELKSMINEYLPVCIGKYGEPAAPPA